MPFVYYREAHGVLRLGVPDHVLFAQRIYGMLLWRVWTIAGEADSACWRCSLAAVASIKSEAALRGGCWQRRPLSFGERLNLDKILMANALTM
jgi:hypothetical protein